MESYRTHAWHNKIAAKVDAVARLAEIRANKPSNQIALREKFLAVEISAEQFAEFDAVHAKWQTELDAVNAKWQPELDAVKAKWQTELDAVHARLCLPNCPWDGTTIFTHKDPAGDWCMKNEGKPVPQYDRLI